MNMVVRSLSKVLNPLARPVAGTGAIGVWGVVRHTGRRSGRVYETPIAVARTADGFVIPLPYGERTDWCRNVMAAPVSVVRWHGHDYAVGAPTVVGADVARRAFGSVPSTALGLFGIDRFLKVTAASDASVTGKPSA